MNGTHMDCFEDILMAIGTRGVDAKPAARSLLENLVSALEPAHQAGARAVVARFATADDFIALWQELQAFAPFLEHLMPPPATAELPAFDDEEHPATASPSPAAVPVTGATPLHSSPGELDDFRWEAPPLPEEMLADFFAEVGEHLDEVSQLVLAVQEPDDPDMYELYRKLHTVKGNSGMVGLNELQEVAHGMEEVVKELRSRGEVPSDALRTVLADGAQLAATILRLAEEGGTGRLPVSNYTERLKAVLAGGEIVTPSPVSPAAPAPPMAPQRPPSNSAGPSAEELALVAELSVAAEALSFPASATATGAPSPGAAGKRMLRVDFAQVDQLAALVGEQAVRQEEVGKHIERLEEGVELLHRQLKRGSNLPGAAERQAVEQVRAVSKDLGGILSGLEGTSQALDMVSTDIQRTVLNLRMTPLEALFSKHRMTVFQAANVQGKKARLVVEAGDTKLDKSLAEKLEEPLIHLIRNAVSHGIQIPAERAQVGKAAEGTVTIRAFHRGNQVVVQVEDDGVGLAADVIRRKAVEKGFLTEEESHKVDDRRIVDYIFAAGFSTTTVADDVSGRGVGLDVVRDKVNRMNGAVEIFSELGKGTVFQLTLPLTLALARVLLAEVAGEMTALPADAVLRVETLPIETVVTVEGRKMVRLGEETLPLINLSRTLGLSSFAHRPTELVAAIATFGNQRAALVVDRVLLPTQAVVREVGPVMPSIRHCMGVTFHEGRCVLIVDVGSVLRDWAVDQTLREPEVLEGFVGIVTQEPGRFNALARPGREAGVNLVLIHPDRLEAALLSSLGLICLDGMISDLEGVAETCSKQGAACPMVVLSPDGVELAERNLDRLFVAGAQDVWSLDDGLDVLLRRIRRAASPGGGRR